MFGVVIGVGLGVLLLVGALVGVVVVCGAGLVLVLGGVVLGLVLGGVVGVSSGEAGRLRLGVSVALFEWAGVVLGDE